VQQLRRVGAAFTAEEAKQIKQMAEHGHVLEAQKAILDALAKSYGGTAKAVANVTPWTRLRETIKNLSATRSGRCCRRWTGSSAAPRSGPTISRRTPGAAAAEGGHRAPSPSRSSSRRPPTMSPVRSAAGSRRSRCCSR
jgi:hypothetical protein